LNLTVQKSSEFAQADWISIMQKISCEGEDGLLDKQSSSRYDGLSSS